MIGPLKDLFCKPDGNEQHSLQQTRRLAAAALLVEVARADFTQDAAEEQSMASLLTNTLGLDPAEVDALMSRADEAVDEATSLYEFTRLVNEHYDASGKRALIQSMWQVAFADASLDKYEEHLIRRVAELIYLPHEDFIRTKHAARSAAEQHTG